MALSTSANASWRDCGQPTSTGPTPKTSDALTILKAAVGQATDCDALPCICDVSGDGFTNTSDALRTLKFAVGQEVALECDCPPDSGPACTSATLTLLPESQLDQGWTGIAHDSPLASGFSLEVDVAKRCAGNYALCSNDPDCGGNGPCVPTCDCRSDPTCEFVSAGTDKHCVTNLVSCSSNADCPVGVSCVEMAGPPQPISVGGTPYCMVPLFATPLVGSGNVATGDYTWSTTLTARITLGIALDQPCPRCGAASADLAVGDVSTCYGGQINGQACSVDAVSQIFGGTSYDCPPSLQSDIMGSGIAMPLSGITTGTTTRTAQLPCSNFSFKSNPLNAPANPGKCLDNNEACSSNADCKRCVGDSAMGCTSDTDCADTGPCAEAPDQPVSCGYWCHCGFCDGNASQPCMQSSDCLEGQTCQVGPGVGNAPNAPQQRPNDCGFDKFLCGQSETEKCALTQQGTCSLQKYRFCTSDTICSNNGAGLCELAPRSCFESRITRTGIASPLGSYCALEDKPCSTNADCESEGDSCVASSAAPKTVAVTCMPATASGAINSAYGITGPAALSLRSRIVFHPVGEN